METRDQINALESQQLNLQAIMAKSDAHAAKCVKLGLNFAETYPDEFKSYEDARSHYNENEAALAALYEQLENEPEIEIAREE